MVHIPLISVAVLLLIALVGLCVCLVMVLRARTRDSLLHSKAIEDLCSTVAALAEENRKSGDRVLAAANATAYQSVKHMENGSSVAHKLNHRKQVTRHV